VRAVVATGGGGGETPVAVEERANPVPGDCEILVRVRAAGLNAADLAQAAGLYPAPPGSPPDILGLELAGEVEDVGPGATRFTVGDRVMTLVGGGGQAELAVVHERVASPVPLPMPWQEAGAFPEAFTTAHDALFTQCGLRAGERVCIHGAAGGVGAAAVQLAAVAGARAVATVRDEARRDDVAALANGVEVVAPEDFGDHGPFDVVLELIGAPNLAADVAALAPGGRIAVIGVGAGATAELDLLALMRARGRIHGSTLRFRPLEEKAASARAIERHVLPLVTAGRVRVPIEAVFPLADAPAAYERFAQGRKFGKIVLACS